MECLAFRALGFNAFSADILPCTGGWPEYHYQGDAIGLMYAPGTFFSQHGERYDVPRWDLVIAHPPCTYLTKAGAVHLFPNGQLNKDRAGKMADARRFFMMCYNAPTQFVAVENPIPLKCAQLPRPSCYVEPTWYGHQYSKKTLFWLRNLPPLMPTHCRQSEGSYLSHCATTRRSKSFSGVAAAMAQQWGSYVCENLYPD